MQLFDLFAIHDVFGEQYLVYSVWKYVWHNNDGMHTYMYKNESTNTATVFKKTQNPISNMPINLWVS